MKKKRSKLTFDEGEQAWKRRYGYQKANDEAGMPIIEASAADEVSLLLPLCRRLLRYTFPRPARNQIRARHVPVVAGTTKEVAIIFEVQPTC